MIEPSNVMSQQKKRRKTLGVSSYHGIVKGKNEKNMGKYSWLTFDSTPFNFNYTSLHNWHMASMGGPPFLSQAKNMATPVKGNKFYAYFMNSSIRNSDL